MQDKQKVRKICGQQSRFQRIERAVFGEGLTYRGNTLFRVYGPASPFTPGNDNLFEPGQYLLRVHEPGYQEPRAGVEK